MNKSPIIFVLILGLTIPYVYMLQKTAYYEFIFILFRSIIDSTLSSLLSFFAILSLFVYLYRLKFGTGKLQDILLISTISIPLVLPAILMLGLFAFYESNDLLLYFPLARTLFLIGLGSLGIVFPLISMSNHIHSIYKERITPASAVLGTIVIYGLVYFVYVSSPSEINLVRQTYLAEFGTNFIFNSIFSINIILSRILENPLTIPSSVYFNTRNLELERAISGSIFAITSIFYLYYRMFRIDVDDLTFIKTAKNSIAIKISNLGSVGSIVILALILDLVFNLALRQSSINPGTIILNSIIIMGIIILLIGYSERISLNKMET